MMSDHRRRRTASLMMLLLSVALGAPRALASEQGWRLRYGEQSDYSVRYLGVEAGVAQITVGLPMQRFGRDVIPVVCTARSNALANFYKLDDRFVEYLDPATNQTVGSEFYADEGGRRRRERIVYDRETRSASRERQRFDGTTTAATLELPDGAVDVAAAAFTLRQRPLRPGDIYELPIFTGDLSFTTRATVVGPERITTDAGEFEAIEVRVSSQFSGKLAAKKDLVVYFSADARHVPLRVEAEFLLGTVVIALSSYSPGMSGELSP